MIRRYAVVATTHTYGNVTARNTASWGNEALYCGLPCVVDSGPWSDGTYEVRLSSRAWHGHIAPCAEAAPEEAETQLMSLECEATQVVGDVQAIPSRPADLAMVPPLNSAAAAAQELGREGLAGRRATRRQPRCNGPHASTARAPRGDGRARRGARLRRTTRRWRLHGRQAFALGPRWRQLNPRR